jgi:hypothetical protein
MEIIRGKLQKAKKVVIYGPEGVGKSTLAARFPDALFIDVEGSTDNMDVQRTKVPLSWTALRELAKQAARERACKTLVIDTADWAERLCSDHICATKGIDGIEALDYGKGFVFLKEEFGRFLNELTEIVNSGIHVVLTAHAVIRSVKQPEEFGGYDHWELKLSRQVAPLVKEWADMVLFANFKVHVVKQSEKDKTGKAQGGKRVMYTTHHPCWDAKNRQGLPDELPLDYAHIAHIFDAAASAAPVQTPTQAPAPAQAPAQAPAATAPTVTPAQTPVPLPDSAGASTDGFTPIVPFSREAEEIARAFPDTPQPTATQTAMPSAPTAAATPATSHSPPHLAALRQLMEENGVTDQEIQAVVFSKGYFPNETRVEDYPPDFVAGCLVGAWGKVFDAIKLAREGWREF